MTMSNDEYADRNAKSWALVKDMSPEDKDITVWGVLMNMNKIEFEAFCLEAKLSIDDEDDDELFRCPC